MYYLFNTTLKNNTCLAGGAMYVLQDVLYEYDPELIENCTVVGN